jgi:hypothetical protein
MRRGIYSLTLYLYQAPRMDQLMLSATYTLRLNVDFDS